MPQWCAGSQAAPSKAMAHCWRDWSNPLQTPTRRRPGNSSRRNSWLPSEVSHSSGAIKKLLFGVHLLEKLGWVHEGLVIQGDWLLVEAMERRLAKEQAAKSKTGANMQDIQDLAGVASSFEEWEIVGLVVLSCGYHVDYCSRHLKRQQSTWMGRRRLNPERLDSITLDVPLIVLTKVPSTGTIRPYPSMSSQKVSCEFCPANSGEL